MSEVLFDGETGFVRFRFVADALGQEGATIHEVSGDFQWICETFAVPVLNGQDLMPEQIIISIADRAVPFGQSDPEAIQFFTGFTSDGVNCTEELF